MRGAGLSRCAIVVLLYVVAVVWVVPAVAQSPAAARRVALVIGNFGYEHVPRLANPGNDATLIAATLRQLGFTLVGGGVQENIDKAHFDPLVPMAAPCRSAPTCTCGLAWRAASARTGTNAMSCSMACCGEAGWRMNRARC